MKYYKPWLKKRLSVGKTATPTYAIIDSQSVKTTSKSEQKGFEPSWFYRRQVCLSQAA